MTREEILAEINRLKIELREIKDGINDLIRGLPEARRNDQQQRKEWARMGHPLNRPTCIGEERNLDTAISEWRQKRDTAIAQIEELKAQLHSQPNPPIVDSPRIVGVVKWYKEEKGFGFIRVDGQPDAWVPKSSLMESTSLKTGDKVTFKCIQGPKGFKAVDVRYFTE